MTSGRVNHWMADDDHIMHQSQSHPQVPRLTKASVCPETPSYHSTVLPYPPGMPNLSEVQVTLIPQHPTSKNSQFLTAEQYMATGQG